MKQDFAIKAIWTDAFRSVDDVMISKGELSALDKIAVSSFARGGGN